MKGTRRVKTFYPTMSPSPLAMTQGITFGEARMVYHPGRGGLGVTAAKPPSRWLHRCFQLDKKIAREDHPIRRKE